MESASFDDDYWTIVCETNILSFPRLFPIFDTLLQWGNVSKGKTSVGELPVGKMR